MAETAELMTIDEVAHLLHTPCSTLRYWRYLGTGPNSFRPGRRVLYRRQDVDDWIAEQSRPPAHVTP